MSGGQVEIRDGLNEGDIVVARAGALLREGDPVRAVTASGTKGFRRRGIAGLSCLTNRDGLDGPRHRPVRGTPDGRLG